MTWGILREGYLDNMKNMREVKVSSIKKYELFTEQQLEKVIEKNSVENKNNIQTIENRMDIDNEYLNIVEN